MNGAPGQQRPLAAIGLAMFAVFSFTLLDSGAKYLSGHVAMPQIVWGRFICHFALLFVLVPKTGLAVFVRTARPGAQLARAAALIATTTSMFFAVKYLPLAETYAVSFVSPFLVALGAALFLGERVGRRRWLAVAGGFAGVCIVLRPGGIMFGWPLVLPLGMAISWAACLLITRQLGPTEHPLATLFYSALLGAVCSSLAVPFFWQPLALADWLVLICMGAAGLVGQLASIRAYALGEASLLAPLGYTQIIWAGLIGLVIFGDVPDVGTIVGAAVVVASGLFLLGRSNATDRI